MNDVADTTDSINDEDKHPRRERWRDAILRTKSKWKKERDSPAPQGFKLSDDVNEFLAAGRKQTAYTTVKSIPDEHHESSRPSTADSSTAGQPNLRGVAVPRLDIAQSQRWPNARSFNDDPRWRSEDHLAPNYQERHSIYERSQSFNSALAKKRIKPRGLSVTFSMTAPDIIGEGGDSATMPTCEISKAKRRSRSLSPYVARPISMQSSHSNSSNGQSPIRRKPLPPSPQQRAEREDSIFQPKPMRRAQTGFMGQEVVDTSPSVSSSQQLSPAGSTLSRTEQSPNATRTLEQQLQDAFHLGGRHESVNPVADSRTRRGSTPPPQPPPQQLVSQRTNFQPVVASSQRTEPQYSYQSSSQTMDQPDLQQSSDTSGRPPAMKVPNFYAGLGRQDHRQPPKGEDEFFLHHAQATASNPYSRPRPNFTGQPQLRSIVEGMMKRDPSPMQREHPG